MKIFCLIVSIMLNLAGTPHSYYAKAINSNVYFCSNPNDQSIVFEIPNSYYVKLLDYKDNYYKVEYLGLVGFVKADAVVATKNTPTQPYLNMATFRVFATDGATLRLEPKKNSTIHCTLPTTKEIQYVGQIKGEELISGRGNIWYYACYTKNNTKYTGYVYAGLCDMLSNITPNTEQYQSIPNPFVNVSSQYIKNLKQSTSFKTILIIIVCLPAVALVYLLFKPSMIAKSKSKPSKENVYEDYEL